MPLFVFDGSTLPKRLLLGVGIGTVEGPDYFLLSVTGSPVAGISGLISGSVPFADQNGQLTQDNANLFFDNSTKTLMLGTNLPKVGFTGNFVFVQKNSQAGASFLSFYTGTPVSPSFLTFVTARGTETIPTAIKAGDVYARITFTGNYGTGPLQYPTPSPSKFDVVTDSDWVSGSYGNHMSWFTTLTGSSVVRETMRLDGGGNLALSGTMTVGVQGIWSPTFKGGTVAGSFTYAGGGSTGWYMKIGGFVYFSGRCAITAIVSAPTGSMTIEGLPFNCDATYGNGVFFHTVSNFKYATSSLGLFGTINAGTNFINLRESFTNAGFVSVPGSNFTNASCDIRFSGFYLTG
jgi:hypothetical protein